MSIDQISHEPVPVVGCGRVANKRREAVARKVGALRMVVCDIEPAGAAADAGQGRSVDTDSAS